MTNNIIIDTTLNYWTSGKKIKRTPKGWYSGNAVCCIHNGETQDTRGRGGIIVNESLKISYSCFNCGFTTGWKPGWHLSYKFRNLLLWLGVSESEIKRLRFEAMRVRQDVGEPNDIEHDINISFESKPLPETAKTIEEWITWFAMTCSKVSEYDQDLLNVITYCHQRGLSDEQIKQFYWCPERETNMYRRILIPFHWKGELIGYTGRSIKYSSVLKYLNVVDSDYVYGVDNQKEDYSFVIGVEGIFDALSINGISFMGNEISETQAEIAERINKEIIIVPDRDKSGQRIIDSALEYGWSVAFPEWADSGVKDLNDAVVKYGKIFCLQMILHTKESSSLKIELMRKKWFKENK